ncbi:MAG: 3-deoxy-7-phosphoheptulonate synthase, partial [Bifidobacterium mongoliense]|nr:3-deoxy-7-phosphoheptulonate synthase [Bifidobacterium mongoliense]
MSEYRGPNSAEDARRLDAGAVLPETVDVNIRLLDPIPAPRTFLRELPPTDAMRDVVLASREAIRDVLAGRDDRLLVIVGPCSVHDPRAALEYAKRLLALRDELDDELLIVMRVYFEKPRTTIGWKGLINDPDLDGHADIRKGMWMARKILTDIVSAGLPTA